jgi:glycosyltransferase involved in cell wall biosynthesis
MTVPLASVVMLVYNHAPYIAQAIESVLNQQTDFPFELVIGEDCSTDGTRELVKDYQRRFPEIVRTVMSEHNVGARKNGLRTREACRGNYIAFCEGDDYWHDPHKLATQVRYLENNPGCGFVQTNTRAYHEDTGEFTPSFLTRLGPCPVETYYEDVLCLRRAAGIVGVCIKKTLLFDLMANNPELTSGEFVMGDVQLCLEAARATQVAFIDKDMATYRIHRGSLSRGDTAKKRLEFVVGSKKLREHYLRKYPIAKDKDLALRRKCAQMQLSLAYIAGDRIRAAEAMAEIRQLGCGPSLGNYLRYLGTMNPVCRFAAGLVLSAGRWRGRRETIARV